MQTLFKNAIATAALCVCIGGAQAEAIIQNSMVQLGVNDYGQLNVHGGTPATGPDGPGTGTTVVGLRSVVTNSDSTSPDCACEGWGIGIKSSGVSGAANNFVDGVSNLSLKSFTSTASTATSVVDVLAADGSAALRVTHDYRPVAGTPFLYEVFVTITNLLGVDIAAADLVYRRVMDWDVPQSPHESVTIQGVPSGLGVANGTNLAYVSNNGFSSANPLKGDTNQDWLNLDNPAHEGLTTLHVNENFTDQRGDNGALFDFEFAGLASGASTSFSTYYGWAPSKADADLARRMVDGDASDVDISLYSYGTCGDADLGCDGAAGTPDTFIFGFGNFDELPPVDPNQVPEPASLALVGAGLMGLVSASRRRKLAARAIAAA